MLGPSVEDSKHQWQKFGVNGYNVRLERMKEKYTKNKWFKCL